MTSADWVGIIGVGGNHRCGRDQTIWECFSAPNHVWKQMKESREFQILQVLFPDMAADDQSTNPKPQLAGALSSSRRCCW